VVNKEVKIKIPVSEIDLLRKDCEKFRCKRIERCIDLLNTGEIPKVMVSCYKADEEYWRSFNAPITLSLLRKMVEDLEKKMAERRYVLQRIEWVTTGWQGPCDLNQKSKCDMRGAEETRRESGKKGKKKCEGCSEAWALQNWEWHFNPPSTAPSTLNPGDLILLISRNSEDRLYYCIGLGFVKEYKNNKVKCDPDKSVAFAFPNGLIEYPWGKRGFPKTPQAAFTYKLKKEKWINLLEEAKEQHKKIKEDQIAQKIEKIINYIKSESSKEKEDKKNESNQIINILNAINTKPFIILSGISGTGKTQIARIISAGIIKGSKENKNKGG